MRERRSEYDVTNTVDLYDVDDVREHVIDIVADTNSRCNKSLLNRAFDDCHRLFTGELPGYLPCDTMYHDLMHTLDMTLALARLINGHERLADRPHRIGVDKAVLGIITALFHDSGYIRRHADHKHHNGAEYTTVHVSRSAEFLKRYLHKIGLGEYAQVSAHMVHYTGYEVAPDHIHLPDGNSHRVGHMLGTADLLAQMSDRCYLEKCRDRLYPEFVLGGVAVQTDEHGREQLIYASGEDLLRKTPAFYEHEVENRLNRLFNKVYDYEISHFGGERMYVHALGQNQAYLKKVIELNDFSLLRRVPPENYGTRNFPGLEAFTELHPGLRRQAG